MNTLRTLAATAILATTALTGCGSHAATGSAPSATPTVTAAATPSATPSAAKATPAATSDPMASVDPTSLAALYCPRNGTDATQEARTAFAGASDVKVTAAVACTDMPNAADVLIVQTGSETQAKRIQAVLFVREGMTIEHHGNTVAISSIPDEYDVDGLARKELQRMLNPQNN